MNAKKHFSFIRFFFWISGRMTWTLSWRLDESNYSTNTHLHLKNQSRELRVTIFGLTSSRGEVHFFFIFLKFLFSSGVQSSYSAKKKKKKIRGINSIRIFFSPVHLSLIFLLFFFNNFLPVQKNIMCQRHDKSCLHKKFCKLPSGLICLIYIFFQFIVSTFFWLGLEARKKNLFFGLPTHP